MEVDAGLGAVDDFLKPTQELKKKKSYSTEIRHGSCIYDVQGEL